MHATYLSELRHCLCVHICECTTLGLWAIETSCEWDSSLTGWLKNTRSCKLWRIIQQPQKYAWLFSYSFFFLFLIAVLSSDTHLNFSGEIQLFFSLPARFFKQCWQSHKILHSSEPHIHISPNSEPLVLNLEFSFFNLAFLKEYTSWDRAKSFI